MKKGLSVLLIAAALFGFYGGAVNLNDVLACKDYWEEEGEKSTADMNKLEDGLNQLKDNEQAYLDGLDAVAEGEEALAQGEQDYADGQATLAKGEADYAAAPGKLAAGEKKLAAGKKQLAAGKATLAAGIAALESLANVKNKVAKVEPAYNPWLEKFNKLTKDIIDDPKNPSSGVLYYASAVQQTAAGLKNGYDQLVGGISANLETAKTTYNTLLEKDEELQLKINETTDEAERAELIEQQKVVHQNVEKAKATVTQLTGMKDYFDSKTYSNDLQGVSTSVGGVVTAVSSAQLAATTLRNSKLTDAVDKASTVFSALASDTMINQIAQGDPDSDATKGAMALIAGAGENGGGMYATAAKNAATKFNSDYDALDPAKQTKIANAVANAVQAIFSDSNIMAKLDASQKAALKNYMKPEWIKQMKPLAVPEVLYATMSLGAKGDGNGLLKSLQTIAAAAQQGITDNTPAVEAGKQAVADGEKELAAGQKELNKGYADYKAAPAKLAAGRAQLAEGLQKLMDGRKELAAGKDKLAEYEDGEQQVRDGLATLMGTEPNGGLESILDRRSGDDAFDNGDEHLDLDEGLDAVDVGRGYQADSGELITKEITNRAIGTAAGLGAGALAVLAAILSFLKKNKGSGVCALLSAAAGGAGIAAGTSAGMEFSSIAGSAVGATPWIAFGILAGVAAVHAIAHFASKEA